MTQPAPAPATPPTPTAWLQRVAAARDTQAFVALFNHFAPRIKNYLRRQGVAEAEAEDITQEVMLRVWQRAPQFDASKAAASTWIYTIARNGLMDVWRKQKPGGMAASLITMEAEPPYEPHQAVEQAHDHAALQQTLQVALAQLPPHQRAVVEDAYFDERGQALIARARKIPLGTVKSRLRLALEALRHHITR